jgi:hypothetical protein
LYILPVLLVKGQWLHAFKLLYCLENNNPYFNAYGRARHRR